MLALGLSACVFITDADQEARANARVDRDGDGVIAQEDCDDADARVFPGQLELPNGIDDDCDGRVDDGTAFFDDDGDGFCEQTPCDVADCGRASCGGDCDDARPSVFPGAVEICDGLRNDCDVEFDEHDDRDGDGWSIAQGDTDDRNPADQPTDITQLAAEVTCQVVRIEPDTFTMGCDDQTWCDFWEGPAHEVTITRPYLIMETEVLRRQWDRFMGAKNWAFQDCGPSCPVTRVSWEEAFEFANVINAHYGLPDCLPGHDPYACVGWRLPTEAEWEYAARGRTTDRYAGGSNASLVGWIEDNAGETVHPARLKQPNVHLLFDMTGNVSEWCWDLDQLYLPGALIDPVEVDAVDPPDAVDRIMRGGSGNSRSDFAHVTRRSSNSPFAFDFADTGDDLIDHRPGDPYNWIGFRLVRTAP
jgi:formylglycine-generating enzyme required for sulfatase activity